MELGTHDIVVVASEHTDRNMVTSYENMCIGSGGGGKEGRVKGGGRERKGRKDRRSKRRGGLDRKRK